MADFPLFTSAKGTKGYEVYAPQLFARQLGLFQLVAYPPLRSVNLFSHWRAGREALPQFSYLQYPAIVDGLAMELCADVDDGYVAWWATHRGEYFNQKKGKAIIAYFRTLFAGNYKFVTHADWLQLPGAPKVQPILFPLVVLFII